MHFNSIIVNNLTADNTGAVNTLIWLNIILLSVIVLYFVIRVLHSWKGKYRSIRNKKRAALKKMQEKQDISANNDEAAIAMALYLYFNEMHDEESDVITVKRVSKTYSPWSSKLYGMRNLR